MAKGEKHITDDGSIESCGADPSKPNYRGCPFESNGGHLPADATAGDIEQFNNRAEEVAQESAQQSSVVGAPKNKNKKTDSANELPGDWFQHATGETDSMEAERQGFIDAHEGDMFKQLSETTRQAQVDKLVRETEALSPVPKWKFKTDKEAIDYVDMANNEAMNYNANLLFTDEEEIRESGFDSRDDLLNKTTQIIENSREINQAKKDSGYYSEARFDHNDFDDEVSWNEAHEPKFIDTREFEVMRNERRRSRSLHFQGYDDRMNTFARINGIERDEENHGDIESDKKDNDIANKALRDVSVSLRAYSGASDESEKGKVEYLRDAEEKMDLFNLVRKKMKANERQRKMVGRR